MCADGVDREKINLTTICPITKRQSEFVKADDVVENQPLTLQSCGFDAVGAASERRVRSLLCAILE
jgi:hypothetical protein